MKQIKKFFLEDRNTNWIISLNVFIIFIQGFVDNSWVLNHLEYLFTTAFILEILCKVYEYKKRFFKNIWNIIDFIICISVVPISILILTGMLETGFLVILGLRAIRALKILRLVRFFKRSHTTLGSFLLGLKASLVFLPFLLLIIFLFSILSTVLFQRSAPECFGNPLLSFITTIQIFLVEGWNEIPEKITNSSEGIQYYLVQIYFIFQLIVGGFLALPLFTGTIIDAMASDNNDEVLRILEKQNSKIESVESKLNEIKELLQNKDS